MRELLRGHAERGGTVLLSSHLLGEVEHTVDRLVVIGAGKVVADGPIGTLLAADGVRVRTTDPAALAEALRAAGLPVTADGPELTVAGATVEQGGRIAAAGGHRPRGPRPPGRGTAPPPGPSSSHPRAPPPAPQSTFFHAAPPAPPLPPPPPERIPKVPAVIPPPAAVLPSRPLADRRPPLA